MISWYAVSTFKQYWETHFKSGILFKMLGCAFATGDEMIHSGQMYEKGVIAYNTSIKAVDHWWFPSFLEYTIVYVRGTIVLGQGVYRPCRKSMKIPYQTLSN